MRDIVNFSKSGRVFQSGKFTIVHVDDLATLTFEDADIDALRVCKPKGCDVKLPAAAIERFRKEIIWSLPDYDERASELWKQILIEYAGTYIRDGNQALIEYNDESDAVQLVRNSQRSSTDRVHVCVHSRSSEVSGAISQLAAADTEDLVYWTKDTFGLKPVVSLTHLTIYRHRRARGTVALIAFKGIYASRYLEGSLGFTAFVDNEAPGPSYLIYVNRSRSDALRRILPA